MSALVTYDFRGLIVLVNLHVSDSRKKIFMYLALCFKKHSAIAG